MFKHYFEQIDKVEIWPIISLIIFFVFFLCLILWVITVDKKYIHEMRQLPMDDGQINHENDNNT
jgi:hypothetical protein